MKKSGEWWVNDEEVNMLQYTSVARKRDLSWQDNFPKYLLKYVNEYERKVYIDIGANYGFMAAALSLEFENVYAFEMIPKTYDCLEQNCKDFANITTYQVGLGDTESTMYAKRRKKTAGHSQIINDPQDLKKYKQGNHPKQRHIELFQIPVKTLDSFKFSRIDLLKIDVEGFEEYVLEGAKETLQLCNPIVALEVTLDKKTSVNRNKDCIELLQSWGYTLVDNRKDDFIFKKID